MAMAPSTSTASTAPATYSVVSLSPESAAAAAVSTSQLAPVNRVALQLQVNFLSIASPSTATPLAQPRPSGPCSETDVSLRSTSNAHSRSASSTPAPSRTASFAVYFPSHLMLMAPSPVATSVKALMTLTVPP